MGFDDRGIELDGQGSGVGWSVRWADVSSVTLGVAAVDPDGRSVLPVDVTTGNRTTRLLIECDESRAVQMTALEEWLRRRTPFAGPGESLASVFADGPMPLPRGAPPAQSAPYAPQPYAPFHAIGDPLAPHGHGRRPPRRKRRRRMALLVVAVVLLLAAGGLALGLSNPGGRKNAVRPFTPRISPDQRLADELMLTQSDLPPGWSVDTNGAGAGTSPHDQSVEAQITTAFARCAGVTDQQGAVILGGQATDQTAQSSSPIFVSPSAATRSGSTLELQTAASIVRTHRDEQGDLSLFASPRYPQCAASAAASELQLGVNDATGGQEQPGPATARVLSLPLGAPGQAFGLIMTFTVTDRSSAIPVEVEAITIGSDRIEAQLQTFAIGAQIPSDVLAASLSAFEQRVTSQGKSVTV